MTVSIDEIKLKSYMSFDGSANKNSIDQDKLKEYAGFIGLVGNENRAIDYKKFVIDTGLGMHNILHDFVFSSFMASQLKNLLKNGFSVKEASSRPDISDLLEGVSMHIAGECLKKIEGIANPTNREKASLLSETGGGIQREVNRLFNLSKKMLLGKDSRTILSDQYEIISHMTIGASSILDDVGLVHASGLSNTAYIKKNASGQSVFKTFVRDCIRYRKNLNGKVPNLYGYVISRDTNNINVLILNDSGGGDTTDGMSTIAKNFKEALDSISSDIKKITLNGRSSEDITVELSQSADRFLGSSISSIVGSNSGEGSAIGSSIIASISKNIYDGVIHVLGVDKDWSGSESVKEIIKNNLESKFINMDKNGIDENTFFVNSKDPIEVDVGSIVCLRPSRKIKGVVSDTTGSFVNVDVLRKSDSGESYVTASAYVNKQVIPTLKKIVSGSSVAKLLGGGKSDIKFTKHIKEHEALSTSHKVSGNDGSSMELLDSLLEHHTLSRIMLDNVLTSESFEEMRNHINGDADGVIDSVSKIYKEVIGRHRSNRSLASLISDKYTASEDFLGDIEKGNASAESYLDAVESVVNALTSDSDTGDEYLIKIDQAKSNLSAAAANLSGVSEGTKKMAKAIENLSGLDFFKAIDAFHREMGTGTINHEVPSFLKKSFRSTQSDIEGVEKDYVDDIDAEIERAMGSKYFENLVISNRDIIDAVSRSIKYSSPRSKETKESIASIKRDINANCINSVKEDLSKVLYTILKGSIVSRHGLSEDTLDPDDIIRSSNAVEAYRISNLKSIASELKFLLDGGKITDEKEVEDAEQVLSEINERVGGGIPELNPDYKATKTANQLLKSADRALIEANSKNKDMSETLESFSKLAVSKYLESPVGINKLDKHLSEISEKVLSHLDNHELGYSSVPNKADIGKAVQASRVVSAIFKGKFKGVLEAVIESPEFMERVISLLASFGGASDQTRSTNTHKESLVQYNVKKENGDSSLVSFSSSALKTTRSTVLFAIVENLRDVLKKSYTITNEKGKTLLQAFLDIDAIPDSEQTLEGALESLNKVAYGDGSGSNTDRSNPTLNSCIDDVIDGLAPTVISAARKARSKSSHASLMDVFENMITENKADALREKVMRYVGSTGRGGRSLTNQDNILLDLFFSQMGKNNNDISKSIGSLISSTAFSTMTEILFESATGTGNFLRDNIVNKEHTESALDVFASLSYSKSNDFNSDIAVSKLSGQFEIPETADMSALVSHVSAGEKILESVFNHMSLGLLEKLSNAVGATTRSEDVSYIKNLAPDDVGIGLKAKDFLNYREFSVKNEYGDLSIKSMKSVLYRLSESNQTLSSSILSAAKKVNAGFGGTKNSKLIGGNSNSIKEQELEGSVPFSSEVGQAVNAALAILRKYVSENDVEVSELAGVIEEAYSGLCKSLGKCEHTLEVVRNAIQVIPGLKIMDNEAEIDNILKKGIGTSEARKSLSEKILSTKISDSAKKKIKGEIGSAAASIISGDNKVKSLIRQLLKEAFRTMGRRSVLNSDDIKNGFYTIFNARKGGKNVYSGLIQVMHDTAGLASEIAFRIKSSKSGDLKKSAKDFDTIIHKMESILNVGSGGTDHVFNCAKSLFLSSENSPSEENKKFYSGFKESILRPVFNGAIEFYKNMAVMSGYHGSVFEEARRFTLENNENLSDEEKKLFSDDLGLNKTLNALNAFLGKISARVPSEHEIDGGAKLVESLYNICESISALSHKNSKVKYDSFAYLTGDNEYEVLKGWAFAGFRLENAIKKLGDEHATGLEDLGSFQYGDLDLLGSCLVRSKIEDGYSKKSDKELLDLYRNSLNEGNLLSVTTAQSQTVRGTLPTVVKSITNSYLKYLDEEKQLEKKKEESVVENG